MGVIEITNLQRKALKPEPVFCGAAKPRHKKLVLYYSNFRANEPH
ncbi:hypothetical protein APA_4569 [Pseudanabaena sp. lw0831]|nr:hypothetical protein APA_4569 [Pseudanabaena sp. lw0831]